MTVPIIATAVSIVLILALEIIYQAERKRDKNDRD